MGHASGFLYKYEELRTVPNLFNLQFIFLFTRCDDLEDQGKTHIFVLLLTQLAKFFIGILR